MKTLEEREAIEQAFQDGREIEYRPHGDYIWYRTGVLGFNWTTCDYRVYRPVAYAYSDESGNLTWRLSKKWVNNAVRQPEFDIEANP